MTTENGTTARAFPSARWRLSDWPLWRFKYLQGVRDLRVTELGYLLSCDQSMGYRRFLLHDNGGELNVEEIGGQCRRFEESLLLPVHGSPDQTNEQVVHYRLMQFLDGKPIDWDHRIPSLSDDEWTALAPISSSTARKSKPRCVSHGPVGTPLSPRHDEQRSQTQAMVAGELTAAAAMAKDRQVPAVIPYPSYSADVGGYTFTRLPDRWAVERSVRDVACISCAARISGVTCVRSYDGTRAYAETDAQLALLYRIARKRIPSCFCTLHTDSRAIGARDMQARALSALTALSGAAECQVTKAAVVAAVVELQALPLVP